MKTSRLLPFLALGVALANAQNFPNAPSAVERPQSPFWEPLRDPFFYAGVSEFSASAIADVASTTQCEHSIPPACYEAYRGHDRYFFIAPQIALVTAGSYGCSLMLHGHKWWRMACLALPVGLSIQHWQDATHIYSSSSKQ